MNVGRAHTARTDLLILVRGLVADATDVEFSAAVALTVPGIDLERIARARFEGLAAVIAARVRRARGAQ